VFPIGKIEAGNKVTLFDGFSSEAGSSTPVISWKNTTYPTTSAFPMEKLNAPGNRLLLLDHMMASAMTDFQFAENAGRNATRFQQASPARFLDRYLKWREVVADSAVRAELDLLVVNRFTDAGMRHFILGREVLADAGFRLAKLALNPLVASQMSELSKVELKKFLETVRAATESEDFGTKTGAARVLEQNREAFNRLDAVLSGKADPAPDTNRDDPNSGCEFLGRLSATLK